MHSYENKLLRALFLGLFLGTLLLLCVRSEGQTYQPYQNPKIQLFDNNGVIAAGFKLCTFAAGTTTPQVTYADNAGTPNSNPIVLDGSGRATIYLGASSYKFILYDASGDSNCPNSGVSIWTQNNIYDLTQISGAIVANPGAGVSQTITQQTGTSLNVLGAMKTQELNNIVSADQYSGADWCAQVVTAYGARPGAEIQVNNNVASMSTCSADILLPTKTILHFTKSGTYALTTHAIKPAGDSTEVRGTGYGTIVSYTGSSFPYDSDTRQHSTVRDVVWSIASTAPGAMRWQHQTSGSNSNGYVRNATVIAASTWTQNQYGIQLLTDAAGDSNYYNDIELQTFNIDIGAKFQTVNGVANGSNATLMKIKCYGASICADVPNGSDESIRVSSLGAHNFSVGSLTLTAAGTASGGSTVYTGTITGGTANALAGTVFNVAGFTNAANNGIFVCTASSSTTLTLNNTAGVSETHAGTATAGGISVRMGGTSGGDSYGSTDNTIWSDLTELGGNSVTVVYLPGASVNGFYGSSSNTNNVYDVSGVKTNRSSFGAAFYNPAVFSNCMTMGGVESAADISLCRSGTSGSVQLGDLSAYTDWSASKLRLAVNNIATDALTPTQLFLGNSSNVRQASWWAGVNTNLQTGDSMVNNSTTDGTTYTSFQSTYGSWVRECVGSTSDASSNCKFFYRNAGAADGKGTAVVTISNAGVITSGGISTGSAGSANHAVCWKTTTTIGFCSTQPDASGVCTCN